MPLEVASSFLLLIAGVGVFIYGCNLLSSNIESVGSKVMKKLFSKASKRKLYGVGIGTVTTSAIQSSAATIVMVLGFVNAGIMSLGLAASIIYGANIGTTITAWIAAVGTLSAESISMTVIFSSLAGIGALIKIFSKKDSTKAKANIIAGLGLIFVALWIMSGSMSGLVGSPEVKEFVSGINNIFLLILIGFIITAMTQSSSVTSAILISMLPIAGASTGLINLEQAIYITLGANIGSCVIVLVSAMSSTVNAKKTSLIHLYFNVFGVVLFVIAEFVMKGFGTSLSDIFSHVFTGNAGLELATFHTTFKVVTTLIMLPLTGALLALIDKVMKDRGYVDDSPHMMYLNKYMLRNPPIAVQQLKSEVINMSKIAMVNFQLSFSMIKTLNFDEKETFMKNEQTLDFLSKEIANYLVRFSKLTLSRRDRFYVGSVYHTINDLERIGDHAVNIVRYATRLEKIDSRFSPTAIGEISVLESMVMELYDKIIAAYSAMKCDNLDEAHEIEEKIDEYVQKAAENHVERLNRGECKLDVGAEYLSLMSDTERIADHLFNLSKIVRNLAK